MTEVLPIRFTDTPAIGRLCDQQNMRDGTSYAAPAIFDLEGNLRPNIALASKVVRGGRVTQAYVFVLTPELMCFGQDSRDTAAGLRELPAAMYLLRQRGFAGFRSLVPLTMVDQWERSLGKRLRMQRDDAKFANFYRSFRDGVREAPIE